MFKAYMTEDVTLIKKTGNATWGEKTTERTKVKARVEDKNFLFRSGAGEDVAVKAVLYLTDFDMIPSDRVVIKGVEHPILYIKKCKAFSKTLMMEVGLG